MKRLELLCPLAEKNYWIDWLLSHHQGTFEVMPVERYGLPNSLLNRKESVQGFAQWVMLTVVSEKIVCDQLMALLGAESYDRMEVRVFALT